MGIRTKRGANIKIKGQAEKILATSPITETFALYPDDFLHLIPKLLLREGDAVKKGTPIFYSKANPDQKPKEIAEALSKKGITVSPQFVSTILSTSKKKTKTRKAGRPKGR